MYYENAVLPVRLPWLQEVVDEGGEDPQELIAACQHQTTQIMDLMKDTMNPATVATAAPSNHCMSAPPTNTHNSLLKELLISSFV